MNSSLTLVHEGRAERSPLPVNCVLMTYNESLRLPYLIDYYRKLGVSRFFIVDNGSCDESVDFACKQSDAVVYHTKQSHGEARSGVDWIEEICNLHCNDKWVLWVDADELFMYDMCEFADLTHFASYCDRHGFEAVFAVLVDMYSAKPISETHYVRGTNFFKSADLFDRDGYRVTFGKRFPHFFVRGGMRARVFFPERPISQLPLLTKVPFFKWKPGRRLLSSHTTSRMVLSDLTGVLAHFKYFSDFSESTSAEVERAQRLESEVEQYKIYSSVSKTLKKPLQYTGSARFRESSCFLRHSLMRSSWRWVSYVSEFKDSVVFRERIAESSEILRSQRSYNLSLGNVAQLEFVLSKFAE